MLQTITPQAEIDVYLDATNAGTYTYEQCPPLSNLRVIVLEVLLEVGFDPNTSVELIA